MCLGAGSTYVWDPKASARTAGRPSLRARWAGLCKADLEAFSLQLRPRVLSAERASLCLEWAEPPHQNLPASVPTTGMGGAIQIEPLVGCSAARIQGRGLTAQWARFHIEQVALPGSWLSLIPQTPPGPVNFFLAAKFHPRHGVGAAGCRGETWKKTEGTWAYCDPETTNGPLSLGIPSVLLNAPLRILAFGH